MNTLPTPLVFRLAWRYGARAVELGRSATTGLAFPGGVAGSAAGLNVPESNSAGPSLTLVFGSVAPAPWLAVTQGVVLVNPSTRLSVGARSTGIEFPSPR